MTELEYRMHPIGPEVLSMHVAYPLSAINVVLERYRHFAAAAPDELSTALLVWTIDRRAAVRRHRRATPAGRGGPGDIAPYRNIAEPIADLTHVGTYIEEQSALDPLFAAGQRYFW